MADLEIKYNPEIRAAALEIIDKYYNEFRKKDFYSIISQLLIASMMNEGKTDQESKLWLVDMCMKTKRGFHVLKHPELYKPRGSDGR